MSSNEPKPLEELALRSFSDSLERIINYKAIHGTSPSDSDICSAVSMLMQLVGSLHDNEMHRITFWFIANIEIESSAVVAFILNSCLMRCVEMVLDEGPPELRLMACYAARNLVWAAGFEQVPLLLKTKIVHPLIRLIRCPQRDIGSIAEMTINRLLEKAEKLLNRSKRQHM